MLLSLHSDLQVVISGSLACDLIPTAFNFFLRGIKPSAQLHVSVFQPTAHVRVAHRECSIKGSGACISAGSGLVEVGNGD